MNGRRQAGSPLRSFRLQPQIRRQRVDVSLSWMIRRGLPQPRP